MSLRLGLIGHPVQHSLSPPMHQAAFSFFSLQGSYDLIDIPPEELGTRLDELVKEGFSGWNVTVPHKESVYHWVAGIGNLTAEARMVGAVNTVRITSSGAIHGHNTDLGGFLSALSRLAASRRPSAVSCGSSRAPGAAPPPAMADPGSCEV